MKRREFITLLGGAAAVWPLAARAQQSGKLPTIGILGSGTPATQGHWYGAFVQRLRELGWIDGRTVAIEYRWRRGILKGKRKAPLLAWAGLELRGFPTTAAACQLSAAVL